MQAIQVDVDSVASENQPLEMYTGWLSEQHVFGGNNINSRGHTTDFYLGKSDLPRANSSKIAQGKFISGFVLPGQKNLERSHY